MQGTSNSSQGQMPLSSRSRAHYYWKKGYLMLRAVYRLQRYRRCEPSLQRKFPNLITSSQGDQDQEKSSNSHMDAERITQEAVTQSTNLEENVLISEALDVSSNSSSIPSPEPDWDDTIQPIRPEEPVARQLNAELILDNTFHQSRYLSTLNVIRPVPI